MVSTASASNIGGIAQMRYFHNVRAFFLKMRPTLQYLPLVFYPPGYPIPEDRTVSHWVTVFSIEFKAIITMAKHPPRNDWFHRAPDVGGLQRFEAFFAGHGYDLHRHDTYAIGHTLAGVQSFQYRGGWRHSLPGATIVLHPDEAHDGEAGTESGFQYRMMYIEPALIQQMLGGNRCRSSRPGCRTTPACSPPPGAAAQPGLPARLHWKNRTRCSIWRKP